MNFFEQQERSRKNTAVLVFLFGAAVLTLIVVINFFALLIVTYHNKDEYNSGYGDGLTADWQLIIPVSIFVCIIVGLGSVYKLLVLSRGGKTVAEAMGGSLIPPNTDEPELKQLLNVVEEMAIACGTPPPPVYVMKEESGINAFAAGYSPRDAVIGITQGALTSFNRDELQGVIAHEFSHIFNGDMRLNIHLIGVLHGITMIGTIGYYMLRLTPRSGGNGKAGGAIAAFIAAGFGLMVLGYAGTFFGSLIKAAVSRQREYLADASAVQYTRNPAGISGALKVIGGHTAGSALNSPAAADVSHALIAQGLSGFMQTLSRTHPPLKDRIKRIDPNWDGSFIDPIVRSKYLAEERAQQDKATGDLARDKLEKLVAVMAATGADPASQAINQIGNPSQHSMDIASRLIAELPKDVKEAAHDPYGARAVLYALMLDTHHKNRTEQLTHLNLHEEPGVIALLNKLLPTIGDLDVKFRLPLIEMSLPALKQLSIRQHKLLNKSLIALTKMDGRTGLMEWSLQQIVLNHLGRQFQKPSPWKLSSLRLFQAKEDTRIILSAMAYAGHKSESQIVGAFQAAVDALKFKNLELAAIEDIKVSVLTRSLNRLSRIKPVHKQRLLQACAICVAYDQKFTPAEMEMLRAFSAVLDCPMPMIDTVKS